VDFHLLTAFKSLFDGKKYLHRRSNLGDFVASHLYEDLYALGKSKKLAERIARKDRVINQRNTTVGKEARRGDGTFGELVPGVVAISDKSFQVSFGPLANIEIGAEAKILAKAMIKQIDRVASDLRNQVQEFKKHGGNPICVGLIGLNFAPHCTSYEGTRKYSTDGKKHKHPVQEAPEAERRLELHASPHFDEFLFLRFSATNVKPFPFEWVDLQTAKLEYSAMLTRLSREYDTRFP
jgi:hypothetical protein